MKSSGRGHTETVFVARAATAELRAAARRGWSAVLVGDRGSGVTTELNELVTAVGRGAIIPAAAAKSGLDLLHLIADAMGWEVAWHAGRSDAVDCLVTLRELARVGGLNVRDGEVAPVCCLDGLPGPDIVRLLFGDLRDAVRVVPVRWVFGVDREGSGVLLAEPVAAFIDTVIDLAPFSPQQIARIIEDHEPDLSADTKGVVLTASAGNARAVVALLRAVVNGTPDRNALEVRKRARLRAQGMGRAHAMLFYELEALGSASAGDERLLTRLGWSRERARKVLGELEADQLVTSWLEPSGGGRPRQVFAPAGSDTGAPGSADPSAR